MTSEPRDGGEWLRRLAEDPDIADLGVRMRAELRAEAAEYEALAALDLARSRHLLDTLAAAAVRGDEVEIVLAGTRVRGAVEEAVGDLARLRTAQEVVDVYIGAIRLLRVTAAGPAPRAERVRRTATSFRARLAEHEAAPGEVLLETDGPGGSLRGAIEVVAADHLVLGHGGRDRTLVALRDVEAVRSRSVRSR